MKTVLVTGAAGLVGSECVKRFAREGYKVLSIDLCERISGKKFHWSYVEDNRAGDHIWWISDVRKFQSHYPRWKYCHAVPAILKEIHQAIRAER